MLLMLSFFSNLFRCDCAGTGLNGTRRHSRQLPEPFLPLFNIQNSNEMSMLHKRTTYSWKQQVENFPQRLAPEDLSEWYNHSAISDTRDQPRWSWTTSDICICFFFARTTSSGTESICTWSSPVSTTPCSFASHMGLTLISERASSSLFCLELLMKRAEVRFNKRTTTTPNCQFIEVLCFYTNILVPTNSTPTFLMTIDDYCCWTIIATRTNNLFVFWPQKDEPR
jgi:hypothetical protein